MAEFDGQRAALRTSDRRDNVKDMLAGQLRKADCPWPQWW